MNLELRPAPTSDDDDGLVRAALDAAPSALVVIDARGTIAFVNARAELLFGYPRADLIGKPVERLVPERLRGEHAAMRSTLRGDAPFVMGRDRDLVGLRRDGTEVHVEAEVAPLSTPRGLFFVIDVRDVSRRREMERTLRDAEERFRLALDEAPIGMALVALDGTFTRVNRALAEIVGYTPGELTGMTFQAITHPEDLDKDLELAGKLARGEIPRYQLDKRYVRKDGSIVDVILSGSVVRDASGAPLHYIAQVEDVTERKRAADALRGSEARVRELVEAAPEGVFVADLTGRYIDVNAAACRMLGYAREELVGKSIVDLIPPEDVPRLAASRERLLVPGTVETDQWTLLTKDGRALPVEVSTTILADGRWQAFVRDVSDRKRAEQELRRSEESLARAQAVARLGSWDWDLETNQVMRSRAMLDLYGAPASGATATPYAFLDFVHPDDRAPLRRAVDAAIARRGSFSIEHRLARPDGSERVVLHQGELVADDGRPTRMVGTMLDITERKAAERAREAATRRLRTVLDQSPVGLLLVDAPSGQRIEVNGRASTLIGFAVDTTRGLEQYVGHVLTPEGEPLAEDRFPARRALQGEVTRETEFLIRRPDGTTLPVLANAAPVLDERGAVLGAVVAFQDISALKDLERMRIEWTSIVAHDLRQPLNAISLNAQFLSRRIGDVPGGQDPLTQILRAAKRLDRMINDLLDLSRLEVHQLALSRHASDVTALVDPAIARAAAQAPDRPFEVHIARDVPLAPVDTDRFAQIMDNLLSNAVKYGARGTPIEVRVERADGEVAVSVTNEGAGIKPEDLARLFQRFERLPGPGRSAVKGIGLGLHIVQGLVEAHGGRLTVASTPGETTTFRFTLPAAG